MTWVWGAVNAATITVVIWLNGRQLRVGWAIGCVAQLWLVAFGLFGPGPWTFVFQAVPAGMFAFNWWRHPRRVRPRPIFLAREPLSEADSAELAEKFTTAYDTTYLRRPRRGVDD